MIFEVINLEKVHRLNFLNWTEGTVDVSQFKVKKEDKPGIVTVLSKAPKVAKEHEIFGKI